MSAAVQETPFFDRIYREAMGLLIEARNYLRHAQPQERRGLLPSDRLRLCCETLRLTARLTQIVAWLLAQRAAQSGEISREEALADPVTLADIAVCMAADAADETGLPSPLLDLLRRSQRLYVRVARLDSFARRSLGAGRPAI